MKKLIATPEAEAYSPEIRCAVLRVVGLQLLFEWRYWAALLPFLIVGAVALRLVESMRLPLTGMIGATLVVILPGAVLWTFASWRMQRWVLAHRRDKLLHAVEGHLPTTPTSKTK